MKQIFIFLVILFSLTPTVYSQNAPLKLGAERMDVVTRLLKDKRVGLVVNQTSILEKRQIHLLDALVAEGIDVKKVFAPEHGFRGTGDAGEEIKDSRDLKTGIPIISIYGKNKKPSTEQLGDLDVIVFDIQDVGARFYTYISTMHYVICTPAPDASSDTVTFFTWFSIANTFTGTVISSCVLNTRGRVDNSMSGVRTNAVFSAFP